MSYLKIGRGYLGKMEVKTNMMKRGANSKGPGYTIMMMRTILLWIGCLVMLSEAMHGPQPPTTATTMSSASSSTSASSASWYHSQQQPQQQQQPSSVFGVSKRLPSLLQIRGGNVHEPTTFEDVEAILLRAGSEQKLVVIDFSAQWCGPCKMIAPLFKELSESMTDVVFVKVDVDENPDTAAKYNVSAMPTFLFIKGGAIVDRLMGANPERLQELIHDHK